MYYLYPPFCKCDTHWLTWDRKKSFHTANTSCRILTLTCFSMCCVSKFMEWKITPQSHQVITTCSHCKQGWKASAFFPYGVVPPVIKWVIEFTGAKKTLCITSLNESIYETMMNVSAVTQVLTIHTIWSVNNHARIVHKYQHSDAVIWRRQRACDIRLAYVAT